MKKQILSLCLALISVKAWAQPNKLNWINAHAHQLQPTNPSYPFLDTLLAKTTVCAIAEASHGTHQFYAQKAQLIKYLVQKLHYRAVCIEMGYTAIEPINQYLLTGKGDLKKLFSPLRLYNVQEIYDLFTWLRQYNSRHKSAAVSVFGFDTDFLQANISTSAKIGINYINKHAAYRTDLLTTLHRIDTAKTFEGFSGDETKELTKYYQATYAEQSNQPEAQPFLKHLQLLLQLNSMGDPLARDKFMAENIGDYQRGINGKIIVWAHNVHLVKDDQQTGYRGMGYHLAKAYGDAFYSIGMDSYKGSVNVLKDTTFETHQFEARPDSYSALFAQARFADFFVAFPKTDNPFVSDTRNIIYIPANWSKQQALPIRPGVDFDALIFIRESTASQPVH